MRNAYIDTEYSNFFSYSETKSGEILQIAIITDEGDFQSNVMPLRPEVWSKRAEEVHGITLKEAQTFPHPKTVAGKLLEFISSLRNVYTPVGWNCKGDHLHLQRFCGKEKISHSWNLKIREDWVDLLKDAKSIPLKNYQLKTVCNHFGIEEDFHDALGDARATKVLHPHLKVLKNPQLELTPEDDFEKRLLYLSNDYVEIAPQGHIRITSRGTKNKEALRVILDEIAERFYLS